jgi:hypothetical protein
MAIMKRTSPLTVNKQGAVAGSILRGIRPNNMGIRLRVLQEQARGNEGGIRGKFVILDVGDNVHSGALEALLDTVTDAQEVLGIIRAEHRGCVNVANSNILVMQET